MDISVGGSICRFIKCRTNQVILYNMVFIFVFHIFFQIDNESSSMKNDLVSISIDQTCFYCILLYIYIYDRIMGGHSL